MLQGFLETRNLLRALIVCLLLMGSAVLAQEADQNEESPPPDPRQQNRTALLDADTDEARCAAAAAALIQAGDIDWIEAQALTAAMPLRASIALVKGLVLSARTGQPPELKEHCARVLNRFAADRASSVLLVDRLIAIHASKTADRETTLGLIDMLKRALDTRGVDILLVLVESADAAPEGEGAAVKAGALDALRTITRRDFSEDATAWKAYWNENRHLSRDQLLESGILKEMENAINEKDSRILELVKEVVALSQIKAFEYLQNPNLAVKRYAAGFLLDNAAGNPEITGRLNLVAEHIGQGESDKETLIKLLELLGKANGNASGAGVAVLIPFLCDRDAAVVIVAAGSLSALDKKKALKPENYPPIAEGAQSRLAGLKSPDATTDQLKSRLIGLLEECGQAGAVTDSALLKNFAAPGHSAAVRASAIQALGATGEPGALEYLENILKTDPDGGIRFEAANALKLLGKSGKIDQQRLIRILAGGLKDLQNNVRSVSVAGLGYFKCPEVIGILLGHLKEESDGRVCVNIIDILGDFRSLEGLNAVVGAFSLIKSRNLSGTILKDCRAATEGAVRKICAENKEHFFTAGESFYNNQCFALAAESFEQYLAGARSGNGEDVRIAQAKGKIALAYYHSGNLEKAIPLLEELESKKAPEPPRRLRAQLLAEGYLASDRPVDSARWFDIHIGLIPEAEAQNRLTAQAGAWRAHFRGKNFERALELATVLKDREAGNNEYLYRFAISLVRLNRIDEGEKEFRRLLNGRLGEAEKNLEWLVRYELAVILSARKAFAEAQTMIGSPQDPLPPALSDELRTRVTNRRQQVVEEIGKAQENAPPAKEDAATPVKNATPPEKTGTAGDKEPGIKKEPKTEGGEKADPSTNKEKTLSHAVERNQVHP